MDVVVLDGTQRSALAVTRSLGKQGIGVQVGAEEMLSLASRSRYCRNYFRYPSPYSEPTRFLQVLLKHLENQSEILLLPMADATVGELLMAGDTLGLGKVHFPFPDMNVYNAASNKATLFSLARNTRICIPETIVSSEYVEKEVLISRAIKIGFPLIVKPARSRIRNATEWRKTHVCYAHDVSDLRSLLKSFPFNSNTFLIQERVEGPGVGIFLLMKDGEVLAQFAHRRIREKPPSGGVSVLCESISPPPEALDSAVKLLRDLNWYGVAMVEFKWDKRDNLPKLMEVNARFWGSLQLAISSGVDFPYLLYRLAAGDRITPVSVYKIGCKMRWELGDLDHLLIRLFRESKNLSLPRNAPTRMQVLSDFILDFIRPSIKNEIFRLDDPKPFLFELRKYIGAFFS